MTRFRSRSYTAHTLTNFVWLTARNTRQSKVKKFGTAKIDKTI